MSSSPVDPNVQEGSSGTRGWARLTMTLVAFRIKSVHVPFFKRMIAYFDQYQYIEQPKLSLLAKACLI